MVSRAMICAADGGLDRDLELLARDLVPQALADAPADLVGVALEHQLRQRVDHLAVHEDVELHELRLPEPDQLVVERCVPAADGLQPVVEVEDHLAERHLEDELDALLVEVGHAGLRASLLEAQRDDRSEVGGGRDHRRLDEGLLGALDHGRIGEQGRVVHQLDGAAAQRHPVLDRGRGEDDRKAELALDALLHDLEVQEAEEPAAEPVPERDRGVLLVDQRGVVQLELRDGFHQLLVVVGIDRVDRREHDGLHVPESRERRRARPLVVGDRVAHPGVGDRLDVREEVADLAGAEATRSSRARCGRCRPPRPRGPSRCHRNRMRWPTLSVPSKTRTCTTTPR